MAGISSESIDLLCDAHALEVLLLLHGIGEITSVQREGLHQTSEELARAVRRLADLDLVQVVITSDEKGSYRVSMTEKGHRVAALIEALEEELK